MSTSSTSSSTLSNGSSQFAADLQQSLTRSINIASLPITQLNSQINTLQSQSTELNYIDQRVASLQSAVTSLQSALTSGLLSVSSSDSSVSAALSTGAAPGDYTIQVNSIGSYATALSQPGSTAVSTPSSQGISSSNTYSLTVGSNTISITAASSSLHDLANAINSQAGGSAQATIVNVGSSSSPDYRLSLKATGLGDNPISLSDGSSDLISSQTAGSLASYTVAGQSTPVTSDSRTVTLAPGLTVSLVAASTSANPTTITVGQNPAALATALSNFASAYNGVVDELTGQHGTSAGALQGQSVLNSVSSSLRKLGGYTNGSPDASLAAFGITLDTSGHLNVDSSAFTKAANANFSTLTSLLGSTTTSGFLYDATNQLSGLEDPTNGILKLQEAQVAKSISNYQNQISAKQSQVDQLQTNLQAQLAKADASISSLESQVTYYTNLFTTERSYNNIGY